MIRKIVLSFMALMVSAAALAQALTASQAMERAKVLLKGKTLAEVRVTDKKVAATRGGETEAYYVETTSRDTFNITGPAPQPK